MFGVNELFSCYVDRKFEDTLLEGTPNFTLIFRNSLMYQAWRLPADHTGGGCEFQQDILYIQAAKPSWLASGHYDVSLEISQNDDVIGTGYWQPINL